MALRRDSAWAVAVAAELAFVVATIVVVSQSAGWLSTYAGVSLAAAIADVAAGAGLMAVGTAIIATRTPPTVGVVAVLAGVSWLAADWVGWQGGPPAVRTLAMAVALFHLPVVAQLVALQPEAPGRSVAARAAPILYAAAAVLGLGLLLLRDPRLDVRCWSNCTDDVLLVGNVPVVVAALGVALPVFEIAGGAVISGVAGGWLVRGTPRRRLHLASVGVPFLLVGLGAVAHGASLLIDPHEGPRFALHRGLFQARSWALALLAAGLAWSLVREWRARVAVAQLASEIGGSPAGGAIGPALAEAVGDPTLEVLYWIPGAEVYVDASGARRPSPPQDGGRATTPITRDGRLVAVVHHDAIAVPPGGLHRLIGPGATLALENEQLALELVARVAHVRASRSRVVAMGDAARSRLERDLHDGAQQSSLSLIYQLRVAISALAATSDDVLRTGLATALNHAESMLAELRELAHGIHPAILETAGLEPALRSLAETSPLPMRVTSSLTERLPAETERTVYAIVSRALDAAADVEASELVVRVHRVSGAAVVEFDGLTSEVAPELADRVGAAEGRIEWSDPILRVFIPCA